MAPENLHVTLKFLGDVEDTRAGGLIAALASTCAGVAPFEAEVRGLGAFPTLDRPRVIWAGVADGGPALVALAGRVQAALAGLGFPPENRPFASHITLGRVRVPRREPRLAAAVRAAGATGFGRWRVGRVSLMRSELSPRGARYTEVAGVDLVAV